VPGWEPALNKTNHFNRLTGFAAGELAQRLPNPTPEAFVSFGSPVPTQILVLLRVLLDSRRAEIGSLARISVALALHTDEMGHAFFVNQALQEMTGLSIPKTGPLDSRER
jgi:hypothetical protein